MPNRYVEEEAKRCESAFKKLKFKSKKRQKRHVRQQGKSHPPKNIKYRDYIKSHWWKAKRNHILKKRGRKCEKCRSTKRIQVHHLTYERLGRELDSDLQVLCRSCHMLEHNLDPTEAEDELSQEFRSIIG